MIKIICNSDTGKYRCELWEGSTKHPDSVFHYDNFIESKVCPGFNMNYFAWLLEIASKMNFPFHAHEIANYAMEIYNKPIEDFVTFL